MHPLRKLFKKPIRHPELLLFTLSLALRLLWIAFVDRSTPTIDAAEYLELGRTLAETGTFSFGGEVTAFRPPGYPFFISLFHHIPGNPHLYVKLTQAVTGSLLSVLLYRATLLLYGRTSWAWLAACLCAFMPAFLSASAVFWSEGLFAVLVMLAFVPSIMRPDTLRAAIFSGALLGLACYVRPNALLIAPCVFAYLVPQRRFSMYATRTLVVLAFLVLTTMPWAIRNSMLFGEPVWISTHFGMNFYVAHHPGNTVGFSADSTLEAVEHLAIGEPQKSKILFRKGLSYLIENPGKELVLACQRFGTLLLGARDTVYLSFLTHSNQRFSTGPRIIALLNNLLYLALLVGFLAAHCPRAVRNYPHLFGLITAFWGQILFHTAMLVSHRYKFPFLPYMIIVAVPWLSTVPSRISRNTGQGTINTTEEHTAPSASTSAPQKEQAPKCITLHISLGGPPF